MQLCYPIIMKKAWATIFLAAFFFHTVTTPILAFDGSVLGIHILNPSEAQTAQELFKADQRAEDSHYVTIPLTLNDLHKQAEWQAFFTYSRQQHLIPIVRLATKMQGSAWAVPTKKDVVDLITFLSALDWPTEEKYIIVFNEVNHNKEWGNTINPSEYADVLKFSSDWAKSEGKNYKVLPAAMDLAAPNGPSTMEAFNYLEQMRKHEPRIFSYVDYWNSHAYPNPAFSSSPAATGQNSISGFLYELNYLKDKTGHEYQTFITETGWVENSVTRPWLSYYYDYAFQHVWSDPHVKAVTPFVLQGDPGPFSGFTFLTRNGQPTRQYEAYQDALRKFGEKK